jgi:peptide/nickel transport system substrate-binding protein
VVVLFACVAVLVCGCDAAPGNADATVAAGRVTLSPPPTDKPGGTLRLLATTMPSGDPGWADGPGARALLRLVSRQLYDYPTSPDPDVVRSPHPDLAAAMPVVSSDGTEYTVRLRPSARWDSQGVRRVTASDVARGIKRLCTPPDPSPYRGYFAATVVGFAEYCLRLATLPAEMAPAFVEDNDIGGVEVVGDDTVTFHLLAPSSDFADVLALPAASPVPFEALAYPPDSPAFLDNLIALGPYRFAGPPAGREGADGYRLSRNPAWSASSDRIRPALPDHVTIRAGLDENAIQTELETGSADMAIDAAVPAGRADALAAHLDGRLSADGPGSTLLLVVGLGGPAGAVLRDGRVRHALAYCVDRSALTSALGGPVRAHSATQLLQPGMAGYTPLDLFPAAGGAGDAQRCRDGLSAATPGGPVTALTLLTSDTPVDGAAAGALREAFARAGIRLDVRTFPVAGSVRVAGFAQAGLTQDDLVRAGSDPGAVTGPTAAAGPTAVATTWDLALTTLTPQWFGAAGRTVFAPIVDGGWAGPRPVDSGYRSETAVRLLASAVAATDDTARDKIWEQLETEILGDAAVVPLAVLLTPRFHGSNVRGFVGVPSLGVGDPTAVSLGLPFPG